MDERVIAQGLADFICEQAAGVALTRKVVSVRVRIGAARGVVPHALHRAFAGATRGTCLQNAELIVETIDVEAWCPKCHTQCEPEDPRDPTCPFCGMPTPRLVHGREVEIAHIELASQAASPTLDC